MIPRSLAFTVGRRAGPRLLARAKSVLARQHIIPQPQQLRPVPSAHAITQAPSRRRPFSSSSPASSAMATFEEIVSFLETEYKVAKDTIHSGANANYIPELADVNPELFGVAVCSVDGRTWSTGDDNIHFTFQSTIKPLLYCISLEQHGSEFTHRHIGYEPSGQRFNAFVLDEDGKPHNPMINAGAIMSSALVGHGVSPVDGFKKIKNFSEQMNGKSCPINFENSVYLSELNNAERNMALSYFMREKSSFLKNETDINSVIELYFQACSMTTNVVGLATTGATLANAGVCPMNGRKILEPAHVRNCLQLMYACGMYDSSGKFAFEIGLPAKSGVSGALVLVIPGKCGISVWSPRLDKYGNTVRGIYIARQLIQRFPELHMFERLASAQAPNATLSVHPEMLFVHAASMGDLKTVKSLLDSGKVSVNTGDYDGRTALHLAFAEGHENIARFLLKLGANVEAKDRFGNTPRYDAEKKGLAHIIDQIQGGQNGPAKKSPVAQPSSAAAPSSTDTKEAAPVKV